MGAVGTPGGTNPNTANKFVPMPPMIPAPPNVWNEMMWPREFPIAFYEMSFLLPHFLREGRGKLAAYFTRVHNPVWTNPDGMSWIEALSDESKVERHACLTPIWSETAWFADYVLPMGHASERHDLLSQEKTNSGSSFPGESIPMAHSASGRTSNRRIAPVRS
jgi:anaerobic selenocysteine-containing dehydrogenase